MKEVVVYVHGKGGSADEAEHYKPLFVDRNVIGFDYKSNTPWEAKEEFSAFFDKYDDYILVANSIGAYFCMHALAGRSIKKAFFISPIVDMNDLIHNMMDWAGVTEDELRLKREISTSFGETLSYDYLCYVRNNPICWNVPTEILYGAKDYLTSNEVMTAFAKKIGASLTIMKDGEHWFHTPEQMAFLDEWIKNAYKAELI